MPDVEVVRTVAAIVVASVLVIVGVIQGNWLIVGAGASVLGIPGLAAVTLPSRPKGGPGATD